MYMLFIFTNMISGVHLISQFYKDSIYNTPDYLDFSALPPLDLTLNKANSKTKKVQKKCKFHFSYK